MTQLLYDAAGRVTDVIKKLNDSTQRTIARNVYDELGQLKTKRLHVTGTSTQLETVNYEYNIRGWLKAINKDFVKTANSTANWFGQELSYDYGFTANQVNGNIAGSKWKSRSDGKGRAYGYSYDNVNRLTIADFSQNNSAASTTWTKDQHDYSVDQLVHDPNGNILSMRQKGVNGTTIQTVDSLKYGYLLNSNKLSFVTDKKNNSLSQLGDFKEINNNETADYAYDSSGNLIRDLNKNIAVIRYNHLNLPDSIVITGKGTIRYLYDATGNKQRKIVTDNTVSPAKITTTDYTGGFVYRNDTLELIGHEEGRIRPVYVTGQPVKYYYDYFLKDHLGNVRTVLTEQTDLSMYAATMEASNAATETALFSNVEETRVEKPVGYPQDEAAGINEYVAKLNAKDGGKKIGPSLVLKVMAGDTIQIGARAFYKSTGPKDDKSVTPEDMLASLLQAFGGQAGSDAAHANRQAEVASPLGNFNGNDYQRLKEKDLDQNQQDKPKAYLNFVLFDDQFNLVEENSGVRQVKGEPDQLQTLAVDRMAIEKSGFLYVYTSNETEQDVLFDNVTVAAVSGPLLEETHYYPYGLTMAGISSNALKGVNYPQNRKKYNGIEHTTDLDLNQYDAFYRNYDPQLGRWWQIDPKPNDAVSLYAAMDNNPIRYSDFLGDTTIQGAGFWRNTWEGIKDGARSTGQWFKSLGTPEGWGNTLDGMAAMSPFNVDEGSVSARTQMVDNTVNYVADIPNKTSDQIGHDVGYGVEKVGESIVASKGASLIKKGIGVLNSTTLYRAVSGGELTSISETGSLSMKPGTYETGKLFATSSSDAAQFGKGNFGFDQTPNTIVKVKVPNSVMKTVTRFEADGMPAVSIPANQLPKINFIKPLNFSPRPTNPFNSPGW